MLIRRKQLNNSPDSNDKRLEATRQNVLKQAILVVLMLVVTLALVFAMTAAWYTNVVSTGNLTFQAESWGFEGGVQVSEDVIQMTPGDTGVIAMQITNTGDLASTVSVNISKEFMQDPEMQQRLYFYADTTRTVNGETVEKIYLNNAGGYTYHLPAKNALILSEDTYTDVQLKWEWVYDVVGFYFRGVNDGAKFSVTEYLRPVEYCYDDAVYDETTGQLVRVDRETSVLEFLAALTARDGYSGAYSVQTDSATGEAILTQDGEPVVTEQNCYLIDEEENIWLYLCTKQDIQNNTAWDTQYAMAAAQEQQTFQVRIFVIGEQYAQEAVQIRDEEGLAEALRTAENKQITLQQDLFLADAVTLSAGAQAVLDLNGYRIVSSQETVFSVETGAQLTVMDGTIIGDGTKTTAFHSVGGQITVNNLQISDVYRAFSIDDHTTQNALGDNSVIRITDSTVETENVALMVSGDGYASGRKTLLVVQDSTVTSGYIAISGNGTATNPGRWGTDVQIINSNITGKYAAVYQPQMESCMTVSGSILSGWTGIAIKGGSVTVTDSTVTGTGKDSEVTLPSQSNVTASGFVDTGDGIYIENTYGYPVRLAISGSSVITCTAQTAQAVRVYPDLEQVQLELTGGNYATDVTQYLKEGYTCTATQDGYVIAAS